MRFTPLDGVPLGSRTGHLDPGVVLYLQKELGYSAAVMRARVCAAAGWLGAVCVSAANDAARARIDAPGSRVALWVIPTDEEWMIAYHTRALITEDRTTA